MDEEKLIKRKQRAKREGDVKVLAQVSKELGDTYFQLGRMNEALQEYTEQKEVCEALNDKLNYAVANRMIGDVYIGLGDAEQALQYHKIYLEGTQEIGSLLEEQRAWATLGRTYFLLNESYSENAERRTMALDSAKKAYQKSIRICNRWEEMNITSREVTTMRARLLLNWGLVFEAENELEKAIELYKNAAALCRKHELQEESHRIHLTLAAVYERQEKYDEAMELLEEAAKANDPALKADGETAKAELLLRTGKWSDARKTLVALYSTKGLPKDKREAIERFLRIAVTLCRGEEDLRSKSDPSDRSRLYESLGDAAVAANCSERAIDYYRSMLICAEECNSEKVGPALVSLARTLKERLRYDEAIIFARKELSLCSDPREISKSALFLAKLSIDASAPREEIEKSLTIASENARKSNDARLERSILEECLAYSRDKERGTLKIGEMKERLDILRDSDSALPSDSELREEKEEEDDDDNDDDDDDEGETESPAIGADIRLDELSDVEDARRSSERSEHRESHRTRSRPRGRRGQGYRLRKNAKGESELHVACIEGKIERVKELLATGHPTNVRDNCGWTPLHEAANHDHADIAELLIRNGANANDPGGSKCDGITPIMDAASCGNFSTMRVLLKNGADPNARSSDDQTAMDLLKEWRGRAGTLSAEWETEYNDALRELSSMAKRNRERRKKQGNDEERTEDASIDGNIEESERAKMGAAAKEYREAIELLRNRGGGGGGGGRRRKESPSSERRFSRSKVPALLNSDDIPEEDGRHVDNDDDDDDWLEDDRTATGKKRRFSAKKDRGRTIDFGQESRGKAPAKKKRSRSISADSREASATGRNEENTQAEKDAKEWSSSSSSPPPTTTTSRLTDVDGSAMENERKKRRRQTSLLSVGFTRDSASRSPSPAACIATSSTNPSKRTKAQVEVEGKWYDAEVDSTAGQEKKTIEAILEEVEKKFYGDTGCEAKLAVKKGRDGSVEEVVPDERKEYALRCEIIATNVPPAPERYRTICRTWNTPVREALTKRLKACENTSIFRPEWSGESEKEPTVLLKTLEHQKNLRVLCLSGRSLGKLGDLLNACLKRQHSLQEMYLEGCDINGEFLGKIDRLPAQLRELDLSYNPLSTEGSRALENLLATAKELQVLGLRCCQLRSFSAPLLSNRLANLDLSWNPLEERNEAKRSWERQPPQLNLSNTAQANKSYLARNILASAESHRYLESLERLEMASCDMTDADVDLISAQMPNLTRLVLKGNRRVTARSINLLLSRESTPTHIDASGCAEIDEGPLPEAHIRRPESCTLIASMQWKVSKSWLDLWRGKGKAQKLPHNVLILKPASG